MCLSKAINRSCSDKLFWQKHDTKLTEQYKAVLGTNCWEMKKWWWKMRQMHGRQRLSTLTADDTDEAEIDMDKAEIDTHLVHKGVKKGGTCMMYSNGG